MEALHLAAVIFAGVWIARATYLDRLDRAREQQETEPQQETDNAE